MKMDWTPQYSTQYDGEYPMVQIRDACESYCAPLDGMTLREACVEFAATYDHNGEPGNALCYGERYDGPTEDPAESIYFWFDEDPDGSVSFEQSAEIARRDSGC